METNLLDRMLDAYLTNHALVTITLQNKVRVTGRLKAFDSYVIIITGHKREEIVYRHAVSCLSLFAHEDQKRAPAAAAPKTASALPPAPPSPPRVVKPSPERSRPAPPASRPAPASGDAGLNTSMKDGLLKWMQEQKAAK